MAIFSVTKEIKCIVLNWDIYARNVKLLIFQVEIHLLQYLIFMNKNMCIMILKAVFKLLSSKCNLENVVDACSSRSFPVALEYCVK